MRRATSRLFRHALPTTEALPVNRPQLPRGASLLLSAACHAHNAVGRPPANPHPSHLKAPLAASLLLWCYLAYETYEQKKSPRPDLMHPIILPTSELTPHNGHWHEVNGQDWRLISKNSRQAIIHAFILYTLKRELDPTLPPCHIAVDQSGKLRLALDPNLSKRTIDQVFSWPTSEAALLSACSSSTIDTDTPRNYLTLACLPMTNFTRGICELRQANVISADEATTLAGELNKLQRAAQNRLDHHKHSHLTF